MCEACSRAGYINEHRNEMSLPEELGRTRAVPNIIFANHRYTDKSKAKRKLIQSFISELAKDKEFLIAMKIEVGKL